MDISTTTPRGLPSEDLCLSSWSRLDLFCEGWTHFFGLEGRGPRNITFNQLKDLKHFLKYPKMCLSEKRWTYATRTAWG